MELFGYVCSPLCKAKADSHGIKLPVYALQRDVVESRQWRKIVNLTLAACSVGVMLIGVWIWWIAWGSRPKPVFSVRFPEMAYSGQSTICGPAKDQIVFLHGGTLARYDMRLNQQIWSRDLVDHKQVAAEAAREIKEMQDARTRVQQNNPDALDFVSRIPSLEKMTKELEKWAAAEHSLFVYSNNVWVATSTNLTRYDWDGGSPSKEIAFRNAYEGMTVRGDELLLVQREWKRPPVVTHINLSSCEERTEDYGVPPGAETNNPSTSPSLRMLARNANQQEMAGLPTVPGKDMGKPLDPGKVAEQVRHLPLPARIALPAVLAGTLSQERALSEMDDSGGKKTSTLKRDPGEMITFVQNQNGCVQVGVKVVEEKLTERNAMKPQTGKSVLDGNLTAGNSLDAASEILNEMQRARGGGTVLEDESRFRVTLRNPGEEGGWVGEVTGQPELYPLQTVNVLTANKTIIVFDKNYKKLWEGTLNYNVDADISALDPDNAPNGQGPCVERQGILYVFDQGVLSAFDVTTGNVKWRLPSVGISGLFFDDSGHIYVNTTSANLDSIKYSRQINVGSRVSDIVLKLDARTGKIIWRAEPGGLVNYVSGNIIFVSSAYQPPDPDEEEGPFASSGFAGPGAYLRLRRINPRNGSEMWEYYQERAPLDIQFDKNVIRLVFKKEVQVVKFRTF
jgi:outer membrane protein assembly factor BamB